MPKNITHEYCLVSFGANVRMPVTFADGVNYFGDYEEFLAGTPFATLKGDFTHRDMDAAIHSTEPDVLITRNMTGFIGIYGKTVIKYSIGNTLQTALNTSAMKYALDFMRLTNPMAPQVPHVLGGYASPSGGVMISEFMPNSGVVDDQPKEVVDAFQVGKTDRIALYQRAASMAGLSEIHDGFDDSVDSTALDCSPDALVSPLKSLIRFHFSDISGLPKDITTISVN